MFVRQLFLLRGPPDCGRTYDGHEDFLTTYYYNIYGMVW